MILSLFVGSADEWVFVFKDSKAALIKAELSKANGERGVLIVGF